MKTRFSIHRKFVRILTTILSILVILAIALPVTQVAYAVSSSPFVGHWQATDIDGSDIRLSIGGPPSGPFQITWTESYISFCNGEAGIVRGTGQLDESDPNRLEADLQLECFTLEASQDFHFSWRYHPLTGTLSSRHENGAVIIWRHPGKPQPPPPALGLRVNYGHDWVESFYEADHMAWITVTESDGVTVKATAELVTEPKEFWDGETGFQTRLEDWVPAPPDIQPNDWVFGWVDNGASGQVQIGEINGAIDLDADSIHGTVSTDWFAEELYIVCDPWGLSDLTQYRESSVYPDGVDEFECSWSGVLDIRPGQELGVWYYGPDGHAIVNAFSTPDTRFTVFPEMNYLEGYEWSEGATVSISVAGKEACSSEAVSGFPEWDPSSTFFSVNFPEGCSIVVGDLITLNSGSLSLTHQVQELDIVEVNLDADTVTGTAVFDPEQYILHTWIHGVDGSYMQLSADGGTWLADFGSQGFDLQSGLGGRVELVDQSSNATAVEWNMPIPHLIAFPAVEQIFGYNWPEGSEVYLTINDPPVFTQTATVGPSSWDPNDIFALFDFNGQYDLKPGDVVTLSGSGIELSYTVLNLSVTNVDAAADTVSGTADSGASLSAAPFGFSDRSLLVTASEDGSWLADFAEVGIDLLVGMCGRSQMFDSVTDNNTAVDWCIPNPTFVAYIPGAIEGYEWPMGSTISININDGEYTAQGIPEQRPDFPEGATRVLFELWRDNFFIEAGDHITMTDGVVTKEVVVTNLTVTGIDVSAGTVTGTYDPAFNLWAWLYGQEGQVPAMDPDAGTWTATFTELAPDAWGGATQWDGDGDGTSLDFQVPVE
jgi:hypothetical protein